MKIAIKNRTYESTHTIDCGDDKYYIVPVPGSGYLFVHTVNDVYSGANWHNKKKDVMKLLDDLEADYNARVSTKAG